MSPTKGSPLGPVARNLRAIVERKPGIHFRALGRAANISSVGQLRHHLDRLEREGLLIEVTDGGYKRFFLANRPNPSLRPALTRFARRIPREIGALLLERPMNRTELRRALGCADSTLGFHLARMVAHGDLVKHPEAKTCLYVLADQETVRTVLRVQREAGRIVEPSDPPTGLLPEPREPEKPPWEPFATTSS